MPWSQRYFKGKKVFVKTDEAGELAADAKGLVPMRYQDVEGAKEYSAHSRNISSEITDQPAPGPKKSSSKGTKPAPPAISLSEIKGASGPRNISHDVPDELIDVAAPEDGVVEVYTDGACSGNPGPCGLGALLRRGDEYEEISQYLGTGTNNIGELMAIRVALEHIKDKSLPVRLYTDSTYCIGVLTKGWKAKANQELIAETKELIKEFDDLRFFKVKGHSGHPLNERADHLATSSLDEA
ncbi:MAG: ribonuclease HI [Bradymonadaceae bacterium]